MIEKYDITVRTVNTETGLIYDESQYTYRVSLYYRRDRQILHNCLDLFIDRLRDNKKEHAVSIEFINNIANPQLKLPF